VYDRDIIGFNYRIRYRNNDEEERGYSYNSTINWKKLVTDKNRKDDSDGSTFLIFSIYMTCNGIGERNQLVSVFYYKHFVYY
jgi:hypothetical protein